MARRRVCDGCGDELQWSYDENPRSPTGTFCYLGKDYDFCKHCANYITRCIKELEEKYTIMGDLKKKIAEMKGQKDLTDFT